MKNKKTDEFSCSPDISTGDCRVEAILSVDERGQMVIPKEIRDSARIRAGDRLALVSYTRKGEVCCMMLIHADKFTNMVKTVLSPVMKDIIGEAGVVRDVSR
jgi:antitoxin PrlF